MATKKTQWRIGVLSLFVLVLAGCGNPGVVGKWYTGAIPPFPGEKAIPNAPARSDFDFEPGGKETITLSFPSRPAVTISARYTVDGHTLTQTIPRGSAGFSGLDHVPVTYTPDAEMLNCKYQVQGKGKYLLLTTDRGDIGLFHVAGG